MATYTNLVTKVRDWANRDTSVLPEAVVESAIKYAADFAYSKLMISELEYIKSYVVRGATPLVYCKEASAGVYTIVSVNDIEDSIIDEDLSNPNVINTSFSVPSDAISYIYLRTTGTVKRPEVGGVVGGVTVTSDNQDTYAVLKADNTIATTPLSFYQEGLFDERLDSRGFYDHNDTEAYTNYFTQKADTIIASGNIEKGQVLELLYYRELPDITSDSNSNWLRDDNERVILFGALHNVFDYLQEDQQALKYKARNLESIQELNSEDKRKRLSGGDSYVRYSGHGLL